MADQQSFEVGSLVELNSGGPVMTVQSQTKDGSYYCQWFAGRKLDQGKFPAESLKVAVLKPAVPLQASESDEK